MYMSRFTPPMEPGTLPTASAMTTFRRTVPLFRCIRLAGIFVKKLNRASDPTAIIGGTRSPKISTGSSNTPPPTPLNPIRMPTTKPTTTLASRSMCNPPSYYAVLRNCSVHSDEALALKVQNNFLRRFFWRQIPGVDGHFRISWRFVWIRDAGELLENSRSGLCVKSLAVPLLADIHGSRDMNENEPSVRFDHLTNVLARRIVRSDGGADRNAAVLRDL